MIITLDGFSGTGKSTLAKMLAQKLNFNFLNTGMIYRALAHYFLENNISTQNEQKLAQALSKISVSIVFIQQQQHVFVNGKDLTPYVSSQKVQQCVSVYAQVLPIREKVLSIQQEYSKNNNIVVEGRDIGSVVFPNAEHKFFITCDLKTRAKRRHLDLINAGQNVTLEQVEQSLKARDEQDTSREFSPLVCPDDAVIIDTSNLTIEQCISQMLSTINM